jgi:hypothetical protein
MTSYYLFDARGGYAEKTGREPTMIELRFDGDGFLLPGDNELTLAELRRSVLVVGPIPQHEGWDQEWRAQLVDNLSLMVGQLWQVGITSIFVDGSFATLKDHPNDIDGYFECSENDVLTARLEQELNLLDPFKVWAWDNESRRPVAGSKKKNGELPMWRQYRVELYRHWGGGAKAARDKSGRVVYFPEFFRTKHDEDGGGPKGIIKIVRDKA